ncbi:MAG: MBL fold metallo-hydrolase, partial [Rikenella sp.]|nr:MBL fold metallo-hydrolase [Rikenella sp.]
MTFQVTILGCSSARPTLARHHTAHVLNVHEQFFLIDCGEGTQYRLLQCGVNPLKINAIFVSHLHGDHVYGIFGLLSTMGMMGRQRGLTIVAPRPFGE